MAAFIRFQAQLPRPVSITAGVVGGHGQPLDGSGEVSGGVDVGEDGIGMKVANCGALCLDQLF